MMYQAGFFDYEERCERLSKDPLVRLKAAIDFQLFRNKLELVDLKERKNASGRPVTDRVVLFLMLVLKSMYNLSFEQVEFQCNDRTSFARFIGLLPNQKAPDASTLWAFQEQLIEAKLIDCLFDLFHNSLSALGVRLESGQMIDATFVPVPKQRNSKEENDQIKSGGGAPSDWSKNKRAQKDVDARWTKKNKVAHYGYKNHVNVDNKTKLISRFEVTHAAEHDIKSMDVLLRPSEKAEGIYGDSAYQSEEKKAIISKKGLRNHINEKGYRNKPLTEKQKISNRFRSGVRSRVEHVFGAMVNDMGGKLVRSIGIVRASACVGLKNLCYNIKRTEFLIRSKNFSFQRVVAPENYQMT